MQYIFAINVGVSLVMGVALLLVWRSDKTQMFAQSAGLAALANITAGLTFPSLQMDSEWLMAMKAVVALGAVLTLVFSYRAVMHLIDRKPTVQASIGIGALYLLFFAAAIKTDAVLGAAFLTGLMYAGCGAFALYYLRKQGGSESLAAVSIVLVGVNLMCRPLYGVDGAVMQLAIATPLKVLLALAIVYTALKRSRRLSDTHFRRFQELSDKSLQGIMVVRGNDLLYANAAALTLFGHATMESAVKAGPWSTVPANGSPLYLSNVQETLNGERTVVEVDRECVRADGKVLYVKFSAWPIEWAGQPASQIVLVDRTAEQQAAAELARAHEENERQRAEFAEQSKNALLRNNAELEMRVQERTRELEAANLAKSQFLANMSHEIRTPMNAIIGLHSLLQTTEMGPLQLDYLRKADRAAKSLLSLLNDVLDFSKIEAGKLELELRPFEIERMMRDLSVVLSTNEKRRQIEFLFDIDPHLPKLLVGDAMRLLQVLINLTGNALKFTSHGEVVTRIELISRDDQQARVRMSVSDTGIGIAPENLNDIFDLFTQAEASTTRRFGGTGLGLSICKRLLDLMGTDLKVESTVGKGSCFSFELTMPVAQGEVEDEFGSVLSRLPEPVTVLVVDDNPVALEAMSRMARAQGWAVDSASSGSQAVGLVENRIVSGSLPYSALFVDWKMDVLDGWHTLERIEALSPMGQTPIAVMVSSNGREHLSSRTAKEQARLSAYLVKPITAEMMKQAIATAVQGRSSVRVGKRPKFVKPKRLAGLRLLVVEDNMMNQLVAKELLRGEGALVEIAENGQLGLEAVQQAASPFDAVLMDMQMPVMDGCTATREIRKTLDDQTLPIIAMTANTMASDRLACLAAGMNEHVGKPFDINYLVEVLLRYCKVLPAEEAQDQEKKVANTTPAQGTLADIARAVEDMGGDLDLYQSLLQMYLLELTPLAADLERLFEAKDLRAAHRMLHTLKGSSATVGATLMYNVALAAELQLKTAGLGFDYQPLLKDVTHAVETTRSAFAPHVQPATA